MNKIVKICLPVLAFTLFGCNDNGKQESLNNDSYTISQFNAFSRSISKLPDDQAKSDRLKAAINKDFNYDELYILMEKKRGKSEDTTLASLIKDYNIEHPEAPVIRGTISDPKDMYLRDYYGVGTTVLRSTFDEKTAQLFQKCVTHDYVVKIEPELVKKVGGDVKNVKIKDIISICNK